MVEIEPKAGGWTGVVHIPPQGLRNAKITVEVDGRDILLEMDEAPGQPAFRGRLSDDGETISGDFTQSRQTAPFQLSRGERPADLDVDIYDDYEKTGTAGSGAGGEWRGILVVGLGKLRLLLQVYTHDDTSLTGSIFSVDQANVEIPISSLTSQDGHVRFKMRKIRATYEGTMNADGSEIQGTWNQRGQELPLIFRRK